MKKQVEIYLINRIAYLKQEHGFDSGKGYAQVEGKGEEKNRAYGEYAALLEVLEVLRDGDS